MQLLKAACQELGDQQPRSWGCLSSAFIGDRQDIENIRWRLQHTPPRKASPVDSHSNPTSFSSNRIIGYIRPRDSRHGRQRRAVFLKIAEYLRPRRSRAMWTCDISSCRVGVAVSIQTLIRVDSHTVGSLGAKKYRYQTTDTAPHVVQIL